MHKLDMSIALAAFCFHFAFLIGKKRQTGETKGMEGEEEGGRVSADDPTRKIMTAVSETGCSPISP